MSYDTVADFDYVLPEDLIAKYPLAERRSSRLLCLDPNKPSIKHLFFKEIEHYFTEKDLLVINDTKVIPARLYGVKRSGGRVECFIERVLSDDRALAQLKASKSPPTGSYLRLSDAIDVQVIGRSGDLFELHFEHERPIFELLNLYGQVPLPPYIDRLPEDTDKDRYQTVYAERLGAVAAPTAGLHFDKDLLKSLLRRGVSIATVTLHVGAGTFQPIRVEHLDDHPMHSELMEVTDGVCQKVLECRQRGGRVIAVGTTSLRCLETAAANGSIKPFKGETDLFIRPGYSFRCVDALITNFHLPKSTLLMLVSAFGGYDFMRQAYHEAIEERYRFYSYGDAMFITKNNADATLKFF